jgi:Nickel responsive protein SCO4226-like
VPTFLVEVYAPRSAEFSMLVERARAASTTEVRYVDSIFAPEDETCFHIFEAPHADAARDATEHHGLSVQRVVETAPMERPGQGGRT